jgi:hypothetical protein
MSDDVLALTVGPDGTLYAGGTFTAAGGGAASRIAKWNGSAWSALGTGMGSVGVSVDALIIGPDGLLYAGGVFQDAGGNPADNIAVWDGSAWSDVGGGVTSQVRALAVGLDGMLYAGGAFTTAGGITANRVAKWDGSAWSALGSGFDASPFALSIGPDGRLYAGGLLTTAGGLTLSDRLAQWNGSVWLPLADIDLPGSPTVYSIIQSVDGKLTIGYSVAGPATTGVTTTATNEGSADAYPKLIVTGPGRLYELTNYTTGQAVYFDLDILSGETVTLDLDPQRVKFTSTFRANLIGKIINGSTVAGWHLQPGENYISLFVDDSSAVAYLVWQQLHEGVDG